ncbi:YceI family protein [Flexithrix dorotheae]|uniref:YceI family protein n=1 Tax=Flexithrix dorotheae TaxID=70993 RepID=UPI00035CF333|nr:YceI family protein [Flexithrix dorotheae]
MTQSNFFKSSIALIITSLLVAFNQPDIPASTTEAIAFADGTYEFASGSKINWKAAKITGKHNGTIDIASGEFKMENGLVTSGNITINLKTIYVEDLKDNPKSQKKLTGHLKSTDFFGVEISPTAEFVITSSTKGGENGATHTLNGTLTIKKITKEISIPVKISEEGSNIKTSAEFRLDRTNWDMMFHSGLEKWGDKAIDDEFDVSFDLVSKKSAS